MSSKDIRYLLQRLSDLEEGKPVTVKHDINYQPKSSGQMPALFKPNSFSMSSGKKTLVESPTKSSLEEAMQEVEEDMLSKVKRDLTSYLDKLEKKVAATRDLTDKIDAAEEEIEEAPFGAAATAALSQGLPPAQVGAADFTDKLNDRGTAGMATGTASKPVSTITTEDGTVCEVHGHGSDYEVRVNGRGLPSRFKNSDDANMAIELFKARRSARAVRPVQQLNQDYIEER